MIFNYGYKSLSNANWKENTNYIILQTMKRLIPSVLFINKNEKKKKNLISPPYPY